MQLLKQFSKKGNTVITSIHQPRTSSFELFDEVTLLSEGRLIYTGDRSELLGYLASRGYPCPNHINPAEFCIDLVSIDYSSSEAEAESRKRILSLAEAFSHHQQQQKTLEEFKYLKAQILKTKNNDSINILKRRPSVIGGVIRGFRSFRILFVRAWKQVTRDKPLNIARFVSNIFFWTFIWCNLFQTV